MTSQLRPALPPEQLKTRLDETASRELQWLLSSLQDSFAALKKGLEECDGLLAAKEPGSTLVVSTARSEAVKGIVNRVGTRLVKADIQLRLQTLPPPNRAPSYPLKLSSETAAPQIVLSQLSSVRNLVIQCLDVVDVSTWSGDAHDASFISGQLRLLHDLIQEAEQTLKGGDEMTSKWCENPQDESAFDPPLPSNLSVDFSISDGSVILFLRTLHAINAGTPTTFTTDAFTGLSLRQRLGLAAKLPDHDEVDQVFTYRGQEVKVREKVRVGSQDPSLMAIMAKLSALEHAIGVARRSLAIVMGVDDDDS